VREPTLVVKSGTGARATTTTVEAVAKQQKRWRSSDRLINGRIPSTINAWKRKRLKKQTIMKIERKKAIQKLTNL